MNIIFFIFITFISLSSHAQNCNALPNSFPSYNQAINAVENSSFKIDESINTSKSEWILKAHYYSCDTKTGFLIIILKSRKYIHANIPVSIWEKFKRANSFGSFYDHNIKGKYRLYLN